LGLRRRALTILFLPIVVLVFMVGWVFYYMGKQQDRGMEAQEKRSFQQGTGIKEEDYVEVGLIEDLMEKTVQN